MTDKKATERDVEPHKLIAKFMSASVPIETYLQQGRPLTDAQLELISLTVAGLQTFLDSWKRKHNKKPLSKLPLS